MMKRLIAALLLLCVALALCACAEKETATTAPTTQAPESTPAATEQTDPTDPSEPAFEGYVITVVDSEGNPIADAVVQMCKLGDDGSCTPGFTDKDGKAWFDLPEDSYKVTFIMLPAGYAYADEVDTFYFEEGSKELTITLVAA